jgi:hypothetical protein
MIFHARETRVHASFSPQGPVGPNLVGRIGLLSGILVLLTGASEPEVIRLRVPAHEISRVFPAGTELKVMTPADFEAKVAAALKGLSSQEVDWPPRLIRARHRAYVKSGVLVGRSELIIEPSRAGPGEYVLEPWTPAIIGTSPTANVVRARSDGRPTLWIDRGSNQTIQLEWELQARTYSPQREFVLRLPGGETSALSLEIPKEWEPAARQGSRRGPIAAHDPARSLWEIDPELGRIDLRILDPGGPGQSSFGPTPWLTTATEIDLRRGKEPKPGAANWTSVWQIGLDPRNTRQLAIDLDAALNPVDVSGPNVKAYRVERHGQTNRLEVALEGNRDSLTELRILAHVDAPTDGAWAIPSAGPAHGVWTGGTTTVLLDDDVVLKEWREKSGRRVFPTGANFGSERRLSFRSESPGPVAELVLAAPRPEASCTVRGQLTIGDSLSRLECQLTCKVQRGLLADLQVDLSPGWVADQVRFREFSDATTWHSSVLDSGATRIQAAVPPAALARQEITLELGAYSGNPGGAGPLELPRARPAAMRIADEAWLAWADNDTIIRPTRARGLAWIDPKSVASPEVLATSAAEKRVALAWRWISEKADARIDLQRVDQGTKASVTTRARIDARGRLLTLDGRILVRAGSDGLDSIPIWVNQPGDSLKSWRFQADGDSSPLQTRPLDQETIARQGLPQGGSARNVLLKLRPGASKAVSFHAELPWTTQSTIPLLSVPGRYFARGVIGIELPAWVRPRVESQGLRLVDPSMIIRRGREIPPDQAPQGQNDLLPDRSSTVRWFTYTEPTSRLDLDTQWLTPFPLAGIIQEAVLTTTVRPGGTALERLRLLVQLGEARSLTIKPGRVSILRVRRDGSDVVSSRSSAGLSIPLESAHAGLRTSTIVLDYTVEGKTDESGTRLLLALPEVGMSCLSFIWEIITPSGWEPADGGGLLANVPPDDSNWPFAPLGIFRPWSLLSWGRETGRESEVYRELDDRLVNLASDDLSFGEWFTRWDAGSRPVVIDRLSLDLAGLGPKSPCVLNRLANQDRSTISKAALRRNGLALFPIHEALVITTEERAQEFAQIGRWREAVVETLSWGSDRTDRLQTVARWRGEPSSKNTSGEGMSGRARVLPGWSSWRYSSSDWPAKSVSVRVVDRRTHMVSACLFAGALLFAYLFVRGWLIRRRAWVILSLPVGGMVLAATLPPSRQGYVAAVAIAGLAAIILELAGGGLRRSAPRQTASQGSGEFWLSRLSRSIVRAMVVGVLVAPLAIAEAATPPDRDTAILALFPYEGTAFDANRPGRSVILRLSDFNRLDRMSRAGALRAPEPSVVRAVSALHRVARDSSQVIVVESEYELTVSGRSPGIWEFPVASTRDITVTVDGKSVPISIKPGGAVAVLEVPLSGGHILRLRRTASCKAEGNQEVLGVPINATPSARLIVEPPRDGAGPAQPTAWGRIERRADRSLVGRLGPADRIEIHWPKTGLAAANPETGTLDGLILWDIHPAGDRVRARFRAQQIQDGSFFRIRHDPNLILRSAQVSDSVDGCWVDSTSRDEWTLHADPPIRSDSTISIDCWMPHPSDHDRNARARDAVRGRAGIIRRLPRLQPLGMGRYAGVLGVRRPGDWTGRLGTLLPATSVGDESFVRAWGNFADDPLTLCGTSRFVGECVAALRTGPAAIRASVRPTVSLNIESGRVAMTVEAEIAELAGHILELDLSVPEDFRIVEVRGEDLTGWSAGPDRQLRLTFDGSVAHPKRQVRIAGWIPLNTDPLQAGPRQRHLRTPWIQGDGIEFATGFLTISSASKTSLQGAAGLTMISSESSPAVGSMPARQRYSYQVDNPRTLGELVWEPIAPQVSVAIESQVTLHPDTAEWVAALRYDVGAGALDSIHLRLPAVWSSAADVHLTGSEYKLTKETRGPNAFWTITPARPIWGSERILIRSALALPADREFVFPELSPLGWGAIDAYVSVVNSTSRPLSIAKSVGLQSVPNASRFRTSEFAPGFGTRWAAFRVMRESWSLQVQMARSGSETDGQAPARVALADLLVSISADGSVTGRAAYELDPGSGRTLAFELPANSVLLAASADSNPTTPLRDSAGRWSILLENPRPSRVCLIWRTPPAAGLADRKPVPLELPRAGIAQSPALVAVHVTPEMIVEGDFGGLEPATTARFELARADRLGRVIGDLVGRIDRSSGRDHEKLVSLLINQELALRDAERSISWADSSARSPSIGSSQRDSAVIESARSDRRELLRRSGLEDDLASAQSYLGQSPKEVERPVVGVPELYALDRIRSRGARTTFVGVVSGVEGPRPRRSLTIEGRSPPEVGHHSANRAVLWFCVIGGISLASMVFRRRAWIDSVFLLLLLTLAGYWGGPYVALGGVGLSAAAWWTRRG